MRSNKSRERVYCENNNNFNDSLLRNSLQISGKPLLARYTLNWQRIKIIGLVKLLKSKND